MRRRPREFSERLGDLPRDLRYPARIDGAPGLPVDLKRQVLRRGNFSPAIQYVTGDGKTAALQLNLRRNYIIIYNPSGANKLWVNLTVAATAGQCIPIPPGGNWEPWIAPINAIFLVGDVAAQTAILMEGNQS